MNKINSQNLFCESNLISTCFKNISCKVHLQIWNNYFEWTYQPCAERSYKKDFSWKDFKVVMILKLLIIHWVFLFVDLPRKRDQQCLQNVQIIWECVFWLYSGISLRSTHHKPDTLSKADKDFSQILEFSGQILSKRISIKGKVP